MGAAASNPTPNPVVPITTPSQSEITDEEVNGVRLEKALDLGTVIFRDKFHETFPRDPRELYEKLQKKKGEIKRYNIYYIIQYLLSVFKTLSVGCAFPEKIHNLHLMRISLF